MVWCTARRAKKVVACLAMVALTAEAVTFASVLLAQSRGVNYAYAIVFRLVVPVAVLVINVLVVREVRRRRSTAAANNLGLQHHHSTSSNSAVPTVMLITTSFVYVLLLGTPAILYVINKWILTNSFIQKEFLFAHALSLFAYAYNFYVYLITGKQFRSELRKLFCCCCSSAVNDDVNIARLGQTTVTSTPRLSSAIELKVLWRKRGGSGSV